MGKSNNPLVATLPHLNFHFCKINSHASIYIETYIVVTSVGKKCKYLRQFSIYMKGIYHK